MKTIHFELRDRYYRDQLVEGWKDLTLLADDEVICSTEINFDVWNTADDDIKDNCRYGLLNNIASKIGKESGYGIEYCFASLDEYQKWYEWKYFIDGEDAHAFIAYYPNSKHSTNWQDRCGVEVGWKYFKVLTAHDFRASTAALLAYTRGYLAGMESNSMFSSEGMEALHCLDLDVLVPEGTSHKSKQQLLAFGE